MWGGRRKEGKGEKEMRMKTSSHAVPRRTDIYLQQECAGP